MPRSLSFLQPRGNDLSDLGRTFRKTGVKVTCLGSGAGDSSWRGSPKGAPTGSEGLGSPAWAKVLGAWELWTLCQAWFSLQSELIVSSQRAGLWKLKRHTWSKCYWLHCDSYVTKPQLPTRREELKRCGRNRSTISPNWD